MRLHRGSARRWRGEHRRGAGSLRWKRISGEICHGLALHQELCEEYVGDFEGWLTLLDSCAQFRFEGAFTRGDEKIIRFFRPYHGKNCVSDGGTTVDRMSSIALLFDGLLRLVENAENNTEPQISLSIAIGKVYEHGFERNLLGLPRLS